MKLLTSILTFLFTGLLISCDKEEEDRLDLNALAAIWELDKFIDKDNNTLLAPKIQISFPENNCLTVFTSFNHGQGEFSVKGNKVTVHDLKLTKRPYDLENDNRFIRNLTGSYLINGDTLRILSDYDFDMVLYKTQIKDTYQGDLSTLLIDSIESNRYFSEDIFDVEFSSVYGKWFFDTEDRGWGEMIPTFDFFEIKKNGIYGIGKGFNLQEYGKISIVHEISISEEKLVVKFFPEYNSDMQPYYRQDLMYKLVYSGKDTMFIHRPCVGCFQRFYRVKQF